MGKVYNTYRVKARREKNGKEFETNFSAYSESDARYCFRACYRHEIYTILEVEKID